MGASGGGHVTVMTQLIDANADVNARDRFGSTPLMMACRHNKEPAVLLLLEKGADVTIVNAYGGTALSSILDNTGHHDDIIAILKAHLADADQEPTVNNNILCLETETGHGNRLMEVFNFEMRTRTQAYYSAQTKAWSKPHTESFDDIPNAPQNLRKAFEQYRAAGGAIGEEVLLPTTSNAGNKNKGPKV
jgi:hypothetical protein